MQQHFHEILDVFSPVNRSLFNARMGKNLVRFFKYRVQTNCFVTVYVLYRMKDVVMLSYSFSNPRKLGRRHMNFR